MIQELMDVLSGKAEQVIARIEHDMLTASEALQFEKAATLRDQLKAIEFITQRHKAVSEKFEDQDVIALAHDEKEAIVQILFIRNGKLIGSDARRLDNTEDARNVEPILDTVLQRLQRNSFRSDFAP